VADHVDTALIFWVELGVYASLIHSRQKDRRSLAVAGIALGCALLTKSLPGFLIAVVALAIFVGREPLIKALTRTGVILAVGALLWVPWLAYSSAAFPREAAQAFGYVMQHLVVPLEGHDDGPLSYLLGMPGYFGELVWVPVAGAIALAMRRHRPGERAVIVWLVSTYAVFSIAQTRIAAFVMIAAPALFLLQAVFWCWLRDRRESLSGSGRVVSNVALALLLVLPARYLLDPANVFERQDRWPAATQRLSKLDAVAIPPNAIIFNMPMALDAMFYSRFIVYPSMPTLAQVRDLQAQGRPVVIYLPDGVPATPDDWGVLTLTPAQLR
jgi:hypothetical protein